MNTNRSVVLRHRPQGTPRPTDFDIATSPMPTPGDGQFLVRIYYCSLDPATRRWMDEDSYGVAIPLNGAISCLIVGKVVTSHCTGFQRGDYVVGLGCVAEYAVMQPGIFTRVIDPSTSPSLTSHLGVLGAIGLTAYNGLLNVGKPKPGETVLVSGAAGAIGSLVGQIARIRGCKAVGIAGGKDKCAQLLDYYGFDEAVDYKNRNLQELTDAVRTACPAGVDVFFDNVGGLTLDAALDVINQNARIVECGMISQYNAVEPPLGPQNIWQVVAKTATMYGFLNRYYAEYFDEALADLSQWADEGRLKWREHIEEGIENFYPAFMRLFEGSNNGKLILKIAQPE